MNFLEQSFYVFSAFSWQLLIYLLQNQSFTDSLQSKCPYKRLLNLTGIPAWMSFLKAGRLLASSLCLVFKIDFLPWYFFDNSLCLNYNEV